jgi:hypothetical protein
MVPADSEGISPVPPYSGIPTHYATDRYGTLTLYGALSQVLSVRLITFCQVLLPRPRRNVIGLGSSPFARHYSGNHNCFLFLRVLRCFSSPRLPSRRSDGSSNHRVAPFRHIRISPCQRVPVPFRRLPRLSSPSEALGIPQTPFCCVYTLNLQCAISIQHVNKLTAYS